MGLYDTIQFPEGFELEGLDGDPSEYEWQTKSIGRPDMTTYRLTEDGRLLEEQWHYEEVPEEQRPYYGDDKWDEDDFYKAVGCLNRIHDGWEDTELHGNIRCCKTTDEGWRDYHLKFTDGELVNIVRMD